MKRRVIACLTALVMAISLIPSSAIAAQSGDTAAEAAAAVTEQEAEPAEEPQKPQESVEPQENTSENAAETGGGTEKAQEDTSEPAQESEQKEAAEETGTDLPQAEDAETDSADIDEMSGENEEAEEAEPAEEITDEAEAASSAMTEAAPEEVKPIAGSLTAKGRGYTVTVTFTEKAGLPEGTKLQVKEITGSAGSNYEDRSADVMNVDSAKITEARFFDINLVDKDGNPLEPNADVKVRIILDRAPADASDVQVIHFDDDSAAGDETVTAKVNGDTDIKFTADSFSVYGVVYTVDFTYGGFTYKMDGDGSVLLSVLAEELGLYEKDYDKAFEISNVSEVTFTDYDLIDVEKQADGDWLLQSLAPFSSEETLTITMNDGVKFIVDVTDDQVSSNLVDFLTNAVITGAAQDSEGRYEVEAGKEYSIILSFAESSSHQFDNRTTLTYTMPDGLTILSRQTGDLKVNIVYKGRTYQVDATYDLDRNGNLQIKFDENDPDFHHLENSTNVSFRFSYYGAFDGSEDKIHFSQDLERDIVFDEPEPGQAFVSKSGTFDEETGKFNYTITVNATGDVTNVNVKDVISGNALIFNNDVQVSGNSSSYRDNGATNGFDYTFASMQEGEEITITYSASVDFSKDENKDGKISVDQTKNTATVKPENGEPHNSEYSHEIAFKTTKKSNGTPDGTTADGDKIYKWTITYNELRLASAGGDTIKDTIAASSTEYMKYYGEGLSINVIDKNGNIVDTRNVPYSSLQSYSDSSWTYKIPDGDTQPYMYEITYHTVVDMEKVEGTGNTVTVTNDANGTSGGADVTPESVISVTKSVDSFTTEEVNWTVALGVPENGLTQAVVTDSLPGIWLNNRQLYDLLKDGSLEITGLLDGESYTVENAGQGQVKITFFQDPGKKITGLKAAPGGHTITVKLTTLVDQEWLQKGYETGKYEQNHTNSVDFNGKTDTATVTFGKPGIEKKGDALTDTEGNITGLKYTVVLKGVSETPVSVLDTFDTSILEVDTAKASSWDHMRIWGGNQWSQDAGRMPVSYTDTGDGIILTADSVPMQADGSYYPYYRIVYYLKVKDGVDLNALAIANGGEYDVDNTVKWGDHESDFSYKVEYDYLDKELLNEGELGGTNRTAQYKITFNPSKATLNEGLDMTMTDVLSANLSVDYSSISIVTEPAGQSVIYSLSGGKDGTTVATYTIPDSTKVTITYDANVRGDGSQTIINKVSVDDKNETVENTKSYGSASEGEGAQASFKIVKVDGYDANIKLQGVKFRIFCENPRVDFGGGQKELILETDENGEITLDGEAYTFYFDEVYHVKEMEAPENYGTISFDYLVTLTNDMQKVDYGHYIYYYSDSMQIKNWPLEGLVVEKQVESSDSADLEAYYNFRISVLNDDGSVNTDFNEKSGDDQFENGVAEFQLKAGEQKMFWGFVKGTRYKVEEIDAEGFATTVTYSVYDEDGNVTEVKTDTTKEHSGELTQEDETIVFKNKKTSSGSLKLTKLVTVNGEKTTGKLADGTYTFTVTGPGADGEVSKTVTITVTDGVAASAAVDGEAVELGDDGYVEVTDLEAGEYTIMETAPTNGTSLVGDNGKKVTVVAGETGTEVSAKADFTNNIDLGSLKVKKNVMVNGESVTDTSADGTYTFLVKGADGFEKEVTITIENGESKEVQVDDLVPGTYTVSEDTDKNPEGMVLVSENDIEVEVEAGENAEIKTAEFTNNRPGTPEFEKKIQDTNDSTGETSGWQDSADYDIGDAVPFKLTATLSKDVTTYKSYSIKFEDEMESTLTFNKISKVLLNGEAITGYDLEKDGDQHFTVTVKWGEGSDTPVSEDLNGATVEVYFTATLNKSANIGSEGNINAARLHYSNNPKNADDFDKTPWDYVIAFTYKLDVNKIDQTGEPVEGAEFKLEKKLADGTTQKVTLTNSGNVFTGTGLDDGDYVLTETKVPAGHKPIDPIEFTVSAAHGITWDYTSDKLDFTGGGRTGVLTALTGETDSGDLEFAEGQSPEGLEGDVTNQAIGDLEISKTVVSDKAADKDQTFTFTIELSDTTISGTYGDMTFEEGVATIELKGGESKIAEGLPTEVDYIVTETEATGFFTEKNGDTGTITTKKSTADFTNTRETGGFSVSKKVESSTASDKDKEFTFTVTLDDDSINGTYGEMEFKDGVATFILKDGESKEAEGLPTTVGFTVEESDNDGFVVTSTGTTGTIKKDASPVAEFVNTKVEGGLAVTKSVTSALEADHSQKFSFKVTLDDKTVNGKYGGMTFTNGVAEFQLADGESCVAEGLAKGIGYRVEEEKDDKFTTSFTGETGTLDEKEPSTAAFVNTRKTGDLEVSKEVVSDRAADKSQIFTFTIELDDKTVTGTYGDITFEEGVAAIELKGGETKKASGLPTGIGYTVTEAAEEGFTTEKSGDTGTISTKTSTAGFTNTRETGDLEISKKVVSDKAADKDQTFSFTIKLSDTSISGTYGGITFAEGVATIELKGGESKTAKGLPTEITYTITEAEAAGFVTEKTGDTGTISTDKSTATFTNTRETGGLKVSKSVVNSTASDKDKEFTFTVTLNDTSITGTYGEMEFTDGIATFTLKDGESKSAEGLPTTVGFAVEESDNDGFVVTSTGTTGTIAKDASPEAAFINTKVEGGLAVTKSVTSDLEADHSQKFSFKVTLDDKAVNGKYGDMTFTDGVAEFQLADGESCVAEGLAKGIGYTVEEEADGRFTTTSTGETGTISDTEVSTAEFTNTRKTGGLEVSKTVVSDRAADKSQTFTFTIELDDKTISGVYGDIEFTNGKATIELKGGETKTATGLPTEVSYKVTEAAVTGFITEMSDTGTISETEAAAADFTNTRETGDLTVSKTVESENAVDTAKEFAFTVTLSDTTINGTYGDMTFTNGVAEFTLKADESRTAEGLPTAITYTVEEEEVSAGYTNTGKTGDTGTISTDPQTAAFVNTYEASGSVVLEAYKELQSEFGKELREDQFSFELYQGDEQLQVRKNDGGGKVTFDPIEYKVEGTYTYTIKETIETKPGYTYDMAEKRVTVTVVNNGDGTLTATPVYDGGSALFINSYETSGSAVLKARKTLENRKLEDKQFIFELVNDETGVVMHTVWNDAGGNITFPAISYTKPGTYNYTIREVVKGEKGYIYDTSEKKAAVTVTDLDEGILVTEVAYDGSGEIPEFVNKYEGSVSVRKTDIMSGKELAGATLQVLDSYGMVIDEWTSTTKDHEVTGLKTGETYTLHEKAAPEGYLIAADTTFILNEDGSLNKGKTTATIDGKGVLLVEDTHSGTRILKVDEKGRPLGGAKLRIEDGKGCAVAKWTSYSTGPVEVKDLKPGVHYFLVETSAPSGYKKAATIEFYVNKDGKIGIVSGGGKVVDNVLIMKDSKVTAKGKKKPHRSTRTGDDANAALWAVLAAAAAAGAAGTVIARKRKKGKKG